MRQQLIDTLTEDVVPLIKDDMTVEAALLKVAHTKNFNVAQLEGLAQIYNTSKTLSVMEKAANRGASFHLVDVPELISQFLEVDEAETKSASIRPVTDESPEFLPSYFRREPETVTEEFPAAQAYVNLKKANSQIGVSRRELERLEEQQFNLNEDIRERLDLLVKSARSLDGLAFDRLESDALYAHGDELQPVIQKVASYLEKSNARIKRASGPGPDRLVRTTPELKLVLEIRDLSTKLASVETSIKSAAPAATEAQRSVGDTFGFGEPAAAPRPAEGGQRRGGQRRGGGKSDPFTEPPSAPPADGGRKGGGGGSKSEGGFFSGINSGLDSVTAPLRAYAGERAVKVLGEVNNSDQKRVDRDMGDLKQMAMLQEMLTTDEVLSEADPEQVLSVFNSLREYMPSLASDPNVMRVTLRSAIQHDGMSPFDVKSFLDTQLSRQKMEWNDRLLSDNKYKGAPLSGKPQ